MLAEVVGLRLLLPGGARADGSDGAASLLRGYGRLAPLGAASVGGARVGARFDGDSPDVLRALAGAEPRLVRGLGATDRLGFAVGLLLLEDLGLAGPGRGLPSELRDGTGVVFASALAASERGGGPSGPSWAPTNSWRSRWAPGAPAWRWRPPAPAPRRP